MNTLSKRLYTSSKSALPKAGKTIWWLLKIILPISLIVSFLQYWGVIVQIATLLSPAFSLIGLPGESAVVFITSIFVPLYGPIAIIATLPMDMREITILALMCLISHNLFVESAVQKKTGSSAILMFFLRLTASILGAFILNLILPDHIGSSRVIQKSIEFASTMSMLGNWITSAGYLSLKIALIITGLMMLQSILKEFNILSVISRIFSPLMRIMGLSNDSSFLWFVAQTLGLGYGSAVMIEEVESKSITPQSAILLNYHIAINHSLLEDTLLFVAIGVPAGWIIAPRFILAILLVWGVRGIMRLKQARKEEIKTVFQE
ncbi:MAG: nucleoside recognition domain-containing protein [Paludibacter sp.]|nr:nucleoside recognition domain-containing protein [Paludibacter sp.]